MKRKSVSGCTVNFGVNWKNGATVVRIDCFVCDVLTCFSVAEGVEIAMREGRSRSVLAAYSDVEVECLQDAMRYAWSFMHYPNAGISAQ